MEGWKIWALFGLIAVVMLISAALAAWMYPMPKERPESKSMPTGPLDLYLRGGGTPGNARTMALLAEAQRGHDRRQRDEGIAP